MTNLSGRRLGQYTIVDVIGTGGMALVYRARQENMRRDVAIKIIQSSLAQNPDFIRRFGGRVLTNDELLANATLTPPMLELLEGCVLQNKQHLKDRAVAEIAIRL